jgi:hypothetical protein
MPCQVAFIFCSDHGVPWLELDPACNVKIGKVDDKTSVVRVVLDALPGVFREINGHCIPFLPVEPSDGAIRAIRIVREDSKCLRSLEA